MQGCTSMQSSLGQAILEAYSPTCASCTGACGTRAPCNAVAGRSDSGVLRVVDVMRDRVPRNALHAPLGHMLALHVCGIHLGIVVLQSAQQSAHVQDWLESVW